MNDVVKVAAIFAMALQCFSAGAQQEAKTQVNPTLWHVPLDAGVEQEHWCIGTSAHAVWSG